MLVTHRLWSIRVVDATLLWATRKVYAVVWDNIKARLHCCSQFDLDVVLSKQSTNVQALRRQMLMQCLWMGSKIFLTLVFSTSWTALFQLIKNLLFEVLIFELIKKFWLKLRFVDDDWKMLDSISNSSSDNFYFVDDDWKMFKFKSLKRGVFTDFILIFKCWN